jgi:hypothetical protein
VAVYTPADDVADVKLDSSKVVPEWAGPVPLLLDVVLLFAARGRGYVGVREDSPERGVPSLPKRRSPEGRLSVRGR